MKVVHVVYSYGPDPAGGTEVYVAELVRALAARGVSGVVAAPSATDESYDHAGVPVRRFAMTTGRAPLAEIYGVDPIAAQSFDRLLDAERPDVVHLHAATSACSSALLDRARRRGIATVFTYHTPTASCVRGTMLRFGASVCDGRMDVRECAACTLEGLGAARPLGHAVSLMPRSISAWVGRHGEGGAWTALQMPSLVAARHAESRDVFAAADRIVSLTPWVARVLTLNGVTPDKIVSSPHGVAAATASHSSGRRPRSADGQVRLVHLGRVDPTKGTGLLLDALRAAADLPVALDVFGVAQGERGEAAWRELERRADGDARIRLLAPIAHGAVIDTISQYDALVVPSQWMETGPLVVLEAFAAGVPVIGSALGGIADKVRDDVDGLLVRPHDSVAAWGAAFQRCATDDELLPRLRSGVRPPRTMAEVAADMQELYGAIASRAGHARVKAAV